MKHKKVYADPVARVKAIAAKGRVAHAALREAALALCSAYEQVEVQLKAANELGRRRRAAVRAALSSGFVSE